MVTSQDAVARFGIKQADLASIAPAIILPALGGFLGKKYHGDVGGLVGGITGGLAGQAMREQMAQRNQNTGYSAPGISAPSMPYLLDPTIEDIPPWALNGAQILKHARDMYDTAGLKDLAGDLFTGPAWPVVEGLRKHHSAGEIAGNIGKQTAAGAAGGLMGWGAGALINHLAGRPIKVPILNTPLPTVTGGIGLTLGALAAMRAAH